MPEFVYTAVSPEGAVRKGRRQAVDEAELTRAVGETGHYLLEVHSVAGRAPTHYTGAIPPADLVELTHQIVMLLESGVPIAGGLEDLANGMTDPALKSVILDVKKSVADGQSLSDAMAKYPRIFDQSYISVVVSGQESGKLAPALERLAAAIEWREETRRKIKGAMTYPAILILAVIGLLTLVVTFLVPRLSAIFAKSGVELPALTRGVMAASDFIVHWGVWLAAGLVSAVFGIIAAKRTPGGARAVDAMLLHMPIIGELVRMSQASAFANLFAMLIGAGVHSLRALEITRDATGNRVMKEALDVVNKNVLAGEGISESLRRTGIFPPLVVRMLSVGEQSGRMVEAMDRVTHFYDKEVPRRVKKLMGILEPAVTLISGAAVALAIFAAFLPMVKLFSAIGGKR